MNVQELIETLLRLVPDETDRRRKKVCLSLPNWKGEDHSSYSVRGIDDKHPALLKLIAK